MDLGGTQSFFKAQEPGCDFSVTLRFLSSRKKLVRRRWKQEEYTLKNNITTATNLQYDFVSRKQILNDIKRGSGVQIFEKQWTNEIAWIRLALLTLDSSNFNFTQEGLQRNRINNC